MKNIISTGAGQSSSLTFRTSPDGQPMMDCQENTAPGVEGSGQTYHYMGTRPENVVLETATYQTPKGVLIGTGVVVTDSGSGRGVAWRV